MAFKFGGGRVYETQYVIEGVNAQDPLAGTGFGVEVSQVAIEEMEVITGGVDAEYGDGTSGVVAVRLREGGDKWRFSGPLPKRPAGRPPPQRRVEYRHLQLRHRRPPPKR
jgi:hypothetical protein